MDDVLFIQNYYYYLIVFLLIIVFLSFSSYLRDKFWESGINFFTITFSLYTAFYIGGRDVFIGVDTGRYYQTFTLYKNSYNFFVRKDVFFDFLNYCFSRVFDFQFFLIFCAIVYVFGSLYGLRKIFEKNYYLPFLVFLISPYFINMGINVMRSGVASALFIIGLGVYYSRDKKIKVFLWLLSSVLFHLSMFVPILFFFLARYIKNIKLVILLWIGSILLGIMNINIINSIVDQFDFFNDRIDAYASNMGENNNSAWGNFAIFGFFPVIFGLYNILKLKYENKFYVWMVSAYMLTHIPYIILINTDRASRLGYLAEFMMPILLMFPLLIDSKIKMKYIRFKLSGLILLIFLVKAYKIIIE